MEIHRQRPLSIAAQSVRAREESGRDVVTRRARARFRAALEAHRSGARERAMDLYLQLLQLNPDQPPVLKLLAQVLLDNGDAKNAEPLLRSALRLQPQDPFAHFLLGHALRGLQRWHGALSAYQQTARLDPDQPRLDHFIGLALTGLGRTGEASAAFLRDLTHDPGAAGPCYRTGRILLDQGRLEEGKRFIRRALEMKPDLLGWTAPDPADLWDASPPGGRECSSVVKETEQEAVAAQINPMGSGTTEASPGKKPLPFACFSFPKCGTHLLSDVMIEVSGHSFFWPTEMPSNQASGALLKQLPPDHFLVGHFLANPDFVRGLDQTGTRIIVQYRDPRDQIVSFYHYYSGILDQPDNAISRLLRGVPKEEAINMLIAGADPDGERLASEPIKMARWLAGWRASGLPMLLISYEEMVGDKPGAIDRLARFVGVEMDARRRAEIVNNTAFGGPSPTQAAGAVPPGFQRQGRPGDWRRHFTPANEALFQAVAGDCWPAR